jgi:hypothetical protein
MDPRLLADIGIAGASLGAWFALYGTALLLTRPRMPEPAPATQDLGEESPAVVSLLVNRWDVTEDAAESTLLDLAARRLIELRQPADDPMHTTLHVRDPRPPDLAPYERRVLDRVNRLAMGGVVPLTALTFRDQSGAKSWTKGLRADVVAEARARGLSRRRFGPSLVGMLTGAAAMAAIGVAAAAFHYGVWTDDEDNPGVGAGIVTFVVLSIVIGLTTGERDTPLGREVAARWLGVRRWLRAHEQFADLPPAAVAVWDRYLAYGAATGTAHLASAVLDLGMGNRRLVWSGHGGAWHRVRVRYPRLWRRYGLTAPALLLRAGLALFAGGVLVRLHGFPAELRNEGDEAFARAMDLTTTIALWLGLALLVYGGYVLLRTVIDLATTRALSGEVLWVEKWRSKPGGENEPPRPWLHYLAIDDGRGDRTTAWGLPSEHAGRLHDSDQVVVRVRPWSRRVVAIESVRRGRGLADAAVGGTGHAGPYEEASVPLPTPSTDEGGTA